MSKIDVWGQAESLVESDHRTRQRPKSSTGFAKPDVDAFLAHSSGDTTTQHDDDLRASGTFGHGGEYSYSYDDSVGSGAGTGTGSFATSVSFTISYYRHQLDSYAGPDSGNSSSSTITGAGRYNYSDSGTYIGSFTMGSFSSSRNDTSVIVEEQATSQTETSSGGYTWTTTVTTTTTTQMTSVATESGQYSGDDVDGHYFNQVAWNSQTVTVTCTDGQCSSEQSGSNGTTTGSGTLGAKPLPNVSTDQQVTMQLGDIIAWYPTHYGSADGPKKPKEHAETMQEEARASTPGANQLPQPAAPGPPISAEAVDGFMEEEVRAPSLTILPTTISLAPRLSAQLLVAAALGAGPARDSDYLALRLAIARGDLIVYQGGGKYMVLSRNGGGTTIVRGPIPEGERLAEAFAKRERQLQEERNKEDWIRFYKTAEVFLAMAPLPIPAGKWRWARFVGDRVGKLVSPIAARVRQWLAPAAKRGAELAGQAATRFKEWLAKKGSRFVGSTDDIVNLGCFPADTLVATDDGFQQISSVRPGHLVWGLNLATQEWELRTVVETYEHDYEGFLVALLVGDEVIEATINHPFWILEGEELDLRERPGVRHVCG